MPQPPILKDRKYIGAPPDLIVIGDDPSRKFLVHRIVLMCISPYFQKIFEYRQSSTECEEIEDDTGHLLTLETIKLPEVNTVTLSAILDYAYRGDVKVNLNNIENLVIAADRFNIFGIIQATTHFLQSVCSFHNCIGIYLFAKAYNFHQLEAAIEMFILKNFESVLNKSKEFVTLAEKELLKRLFSTHFLQVQDEIVVWNCLIKWINFDEPNRALHFEELSSFLRFGLIDERSLQLDVLLHPLVQSCPQIKHLISEVVNTRKMLEECAKPKDVVLNDIVIRHLTPRYPKDIIFVFGGRSLDVEFVTPESVIEAYDHKAERWRQVNIEDPFGPRDHHQLAVIGDFIFVIGGHQGPFNVFNSCRKFNLVTKEWSQIAPMREKRAFHASAIHSNHIYAIGGYNGAWRVDTVERYDIDLNQWSSVACMHERRSGAGATVSNDLIYVVGGFRDLSYLNSAEFYNPSTNQWTLISNMCKPRSSPAVVSFSNMLYVIGGLTPNGLLSSGERYDPKTDSWSLMENDMFEKKCSSAAVVLDDKILVIGGWNGVGGLRTVELWCNKTKKWMLGTKLIKRRTGCAACIVRNISNIEEYAWPTRENIVQERLLNALGQYSNKSDSFQDNELENEAANEQPDPRLLNAVPNNIDELMEVD